MKRTYITILAILLVLTMFFSVTGCGKAANTESEAVNDGFFADAENVIESASGDASNNTSGSSGSTSDSSIDKNTDIPKESVVGGKSWKNVLASMPKKLRGTTVKVMNWNPITEYTGAAVAVKEFEKQTGIKVDWQMVDMSVYVTRLAALVASDKAPDVVRTCTPVPSWMLSFQSLDVANYDFTDNAWDEKVMKDYTVNGVTYATSLNNTHLGTVNMMFYNKELINRYDYEDPYKLWKSGKWTWSKFIEMCKTFKKEANADRACVGAEWEIWSQLYGIPGPVGYDGSKYYSLLGDSKFLTVTQQIADLYHVDQLFHQGQAEEMDAGNVLFYAGASIYLRKNNSYLGELKSSGTLYAVPMPAIDGQSTYYQSRFEYEAYAIAQGAKNPEAVPYFLRYFLDGENYDLNSFFCNRQNLEVYNWCMSQENTIWTTGYNDADDTFGDGKTGLVALQGSQVKSYIDSNANMIDARVSKLNKLLSQLKK